MPSLPPFVSKNSTPGSVSFAATLEDSGVWVFAGDTVPTSRKTCSTASGAPGDEDAAAASLSRRFTEIGATDVLIVPGHDQVVLNAVRHPTGDTDQRRTRWPHGDRYRRSRSDRANPSQSNAPSNILLTSGTR